MPDKSLYRTINNAMNASGCLSGLGLGLLFTFAPRIEGLSYSTSIEMDLVGIGGFIASIGFGYLFFGELRR